MNIRFKKAFNDLWIHPGRTLLVIFALITGLLGVGSLLVSYTVLQNDLKENFIKTSPPHAILVSRDFKKLNIREFRDRPEIESAEFRDFAILRIEVYPDVWIPLWLFGVEDFEKFNLARFYNEKGKKIPDPGTMLMERDGQSISNLRLGKNARVRTGNKIISVAISGIAFDPAQAPATQDHFIYAYVDKKTWTEITGDENGQRLVYRLKNAKSKNDVKTATDKIIEDFKHGNITLSASKIPNFNEHPHQWQLNTLLLLEGSIGFLAFLMGAVLVAQIISAILSRQTRQIGILKAIGATKKDVLQMYITMVLMLAIMACVIAIPLALKSGFAFAHFVAGKLNFNILTTALPAHLYVVLGATGLFMPVLFSMPALLKGTNISVNESLSDYGIRQDKSTGNRKSLFRLPVPAIFTMALRNTSRRKSRLFFTILTMSLGVAIFNTGFNVRQSLRTLLTDVRDSMKHDVQVVLQKQVEKDNALKPFQSLKNLKKIETWNGGKGELQSNIVSTDNGVGVVALPYDTDLFRLKVEKGRWLSGSDKAEVVMNQQAVDIFEHPEVGEIIKLKLGGKQLEAKLAGVVWELDKPKIYIDKKFYDSFANPEHLVNSLMFVANDKDYHAVISLKKEIEKAIAASDLHILYVMSQAERVKIVYDHLNIILTTIVFLALLVLIVSALGMASATGINIMERTREIGVLRAIGAAPDMIYRLFVTEGMIISVISVILGILLSWPLSMAAAPFFGKLMLGDGALLRFAFSYPGFWITLVTTICFGYLASRVPARYAVSVSTREALAYE